MLVSGKYIICMCACFLVCHFLWHWNSNGTGVAEVMPSKVCLVTQLFLNPERKRRRERNVEHAGGSNVNEDEDDNR